MILTFLFYILSIFLKTVAVILPEWSIWPEAVTDGFTYIFSSLAKINILFPIDDLFTIILFLITFEVAFYTTKIIVMAFNFFRGSGKGLDI